MLGPARGSIEWGGIWLQCYPTPELPRQSHETSSKQTQEKVFDYISTIAQKDQSLNSGEKKITPCFRSKPILAGSTEISE